MEAKHIIATDTFRLEIYTLDKETKTLLALAAKQIKTKVERDIPPEQETITLERLHESNVEEELEEENPPQKEPEQKEPEQKEHKEQKRFRLFEDSELLARYHRVPIYRPIVDFITENVVDTFTTKDIKRCIETYYKKELNRELSPQSLRSYASAYIRYFREKLDFTMQEDGQSWRKKGTQEAAEEEQAPDEEEVVPRRMENKRYQYAQQIYETMMNGNQQTNVTIEQIEKATELDRDQIERGLSALVEQNLATQMPQGVNLRKV